MSDVNTLYKRAITRWGEEAQMAMLYEEVGELMMTLGHYQRNRASIADVAGELADVGIMLEQAALVFGCADKVAEMRAAKLARLEKRLDEADAMDRRKGEPL